MDPIYRLVLLTSSGEVWIFAFKMRGLKNLRNMDYMTVSGFN